jgi:thimet oligopeptidase
MLTVCRLQTEYQVDHELIKEYFPLEKVTTGTLAVYQELLSLRFAELPKDKRHVWHEDVKQFEVYDKESNAFMGHFYLDLHPRDGHAL